MSCSMTGITCWCSMDTAGNLAGICCNSIAATIPLLKSGNLLVLQQQIGVGHRLWLTLTTMAGRISISATVTAGMLRIWIILTSTGIP